MIRYNPKDWFTFIFRMHKADTVRRLFPMIIAISIYSGIIAWLEMEIWELGPDHRIKNLPVMHGLLGFVISMLLVFRTNTAYDRWWEGRKLWGSLVNNSRNLASKLHAILDPADKENRSFFRNAIPGFAFALIRHLRSPNATSEMFDGTGDIWKHISAEKHVPNQLASMMFRKTMALHQQEKISGDQLLFIREELGSFTDICGACERIKNTPIPFSYNIFLKKFIFIYVMTLPFGYVFSLGYWVIPIVTFIFYVLASLEIIAEEIEEPFGGDDNDLPLEKISQNIQVHIGEIFDGPVSN